MKNILKASIKAGNKYLILLRSYEEGHAPNTWDFPGGALEMGEEPPGALKLEIYEETGLEAKVFDRLANYEIEIKGMPHNFIIYKVKIISNSPIKLSKEYVAYKWASKEEIKKLKLNPFLSYYLHDPEIN